MRAHLRPLLALLLLAGGCTSLTAPRAGITPTPRVDDPAAEAAYRSTLAQFTRRAEIYDRLDARMFFALTWEAMPFRTARVDRRARFRAIPERERASLLAEEQAEDEEFIVFTMGVHPNERRFDSFGLEGALWRIALVTDAGEALPVSVERLSARPDLSMRAIYPYLDDFWIAYRIKFPARHENGARVLPEGSGRFSVRISSVIGRVELPFEPPSR